MKTVLFGVLILLPVVFCRPAECVAQCYGGQCYGGQCYAPPLDVVGRWQSVSPEPSPTPAMRYENSTGRYQSVVRVKTTDRNGYGSAGSGVAVRWNDQIVILTASHVVRDARCVWVRGLQGYRPVQVLLADAAWDVAVLKPLQSGPADFAPAKVAFFETAHPKPGDRLESCGFGGDDRLAVNMGRFLGYRGNPSDRSALDWLDIAGRARSGDSGGPVFNSQGEVVGILWGTDGRSVTAVQCGRLHLELAKAMGEPANRPLQETPAPQVVMTARQPSETKLGALQGDGLGILSGCCPRLKQKTPEPAPAPQIIIQNDPALQSIDRKMDVVIQNTTRPVVPEKTAEEPNPAILFSVVFGSVLAGFVVYFAAIGKGN